MKTTVEELLGVTLLEGWYHHNKDEGLVINLLIESNGEVEQIKLDGEGIWHVPPPTVRELLEGLPFCRRMKGSKVIFAETLPNGATHIILTTRDSTHKVWIRYTTRGELKMDHLTDKQYREDLLVDWHLYQGGC